ncbi:MAG: hypothetical protein AB1556_07560 [Bacillota bacterium]
MTIIISALTPGGIVMAGEGRCIRVEASEFTDGYNADKKFNFEPVTDNAEKIHLIADRFGLAYSGPDFNEKGWCLQNDINEFDRIVRLNLRHNLSFNIREAAGIFSGLVQKVLPPDMDFGFFWAGYSPRTGKPFQVHYRKGQDVTNTFSLAGRMPTAA